MEEERKKTDTKRLYDIERAVDSIKNTIEHDYRYFLSTARAVGLNQAEFRETLADHGKKLKSLNRWQIATAVAAIASALFAAGIFLIEVGWV